MSADREAAIRTAVEGAMVGAWGQERALFALDELLADFGEKSERLDAVEAELAAAREREAKLREALRPIVREYDLWAEDANDGEFRLWDLDRLCVAIVNARALLADGEGET